MKTCQKFDTEVVSPSAAVTQVEVEVHHHHRHCDILHKGPKLDKLRIKSDEKENGFDAVKADLGITDPGNKAVLKLYKGGAPVTARRRTMELASFDNVFSPYIKPPT